MKNFFAAIIVVICVSGTVSAADSQLVGLMMPDAKVLAGMNIVQVRNSPYGQYLLAQIPLSHPAFQQFVLAAGFDPIRDLTEVVAASAGKPGDKSGLAAVRGNFDIAHILSFVKTTGVKVDQSQGVPVIISPNGQSAVALVDATLALAGDINSLTAALARRSAPSALDPALTAKAATLSVSQDAWVVSTIMPGSVDIGPGGPAGLNLTALQNIQQSSAGVKFGPSVNVSAEVVADTPQNASALADVVRLLVNLGQMSQSSTQGAELAQVLQNLSIQTKGSAIEVSLAIPEEIIEQLSPANRPHGVRKVAERRK